MREIKFRAWHKGTKKMWYSDNKTVDGNEVSFHFYISGIGWGVYDNFLGNRVCSGEHHQLMQFTGMKDKSGVDLYEGDIVQTYTGKRKSARLIIRYFEHSFVMAYKSDTTSMDCIWYYDFEIIGNIYENPKLLNSHP